MSFRHRFLQKGLYTQRHNNVHGANDGTVATSHAEHNTDIFIAIYEVGNSDIAACSSGSITDDCNLTAYCDATGARISKIIAQL